MKDLIDGAELAARVQLALNGTVSDWIRRETATDLDRERFRSLSIVKCASTRKNIERKLEG